MLPKRLALLRLNLRRLLSTWVVLMPFSRYAPVDPQFSFFFGNVGHTCSLMQDVYEVSSVFSRRLKGITECGWSSAVTFRWARKETTKSLRWVRCRHALLSFMAGHCRLHKTCRFFEHYFLRCDFGVYFIEVQMNYTRAYTDKLWLEVFVKMTSMFHAHRNLRFKWNRRRGQQPGARFVIDLQVWSGSLKSKHLWKRLLISPLWWSFSSPWRFADLRVIGILFVQGLAAKQELSKIRCYGLKWIGVVSKM